MTVVPHAPYSPELTLCEYSLFPRLKIRLKGCHFETIEVIEAGSQAALKTLTEDDFQDELKHGSGAYARKGTTSGVGVGVASRPKVTPVAETVDTKQRAVNGDCCEVNLGKVSTDARPAEYPVVSTK
jgi:hypothetical protein